HTRWPRDWSSDVCSSDLGKNQGYCIATDRDGDKAFLVFKCTAQPGARCEGDFQWTGGTGKYVGLRGNNSFNGGPIPKTTSGYSRSEERRVGKEWRTLCVT